MSLDLDYSTETTENVLYFVYEHSASYKEIQQKFLQAVESLNPENIIVSQYAATLVILDLMLRISSIISLIVLSYIMSLFTR